MTVPMSLLRLLPSRVEEPPVVPPPKVDMGSLFDDHASWMRRVAHRLTGSAAAADDVVQEVFCLVFRRKDELDIRLGIRTWLYRAVVNVSRHHRRTVSRHDQMITRFADAPVPSPVGQEDLMNRREHGELVRECAARLPEAQREVFVLFELEDVSGAEIALILGVSVNTVWSRLRIGRDLFRAEWLRLYRGVT